MISCFSDKMFIYVKAVGRFRRKLLPFFNLYRNNSSLPPWKVIFYGTDKLSEITLKALDNDRLSTSSLRVVKTLEVVCIQSDCAVRRYATSKNLVIHTWPFDIVNNVYDVGVVVSFGQMIPSSSIFACKYGIINAHPSLLPRWRGAAPIFYTILSGDRETGVTITQVSPNKFDVGNILMQKKYLLPDNCTTKMLISDLGKMAAEMVLKTLVKLPYYIETSYSQPKEGVTLARKIKPTNCHINWTEDTVNVIERKFRAFNGFFDLCTSWKSKRVVILGIPSVSEIKEAKLSQLVSNTVLPGFGYFHKKRKIIFVKCQDGWSGITVLKIPKRGKISALDFYNGFMSKEDPNKCYFT